MPPKRRAATAAKAKTAAAPAKRKAPAAKSAPASKRTKKQVQDEEEEEEVTVADEVEEEEQPKVEEEAATSSKADIIKQLRAADANKAKTHIPDKNIPGSTNYQVLDDYDAMLNQTNIGANNNKYYVIQVLKQGSNFYTWTRWGRVGESGKSQMFGPFSSGDEAIKQFKSKYKDKTRNNWDSRDHFVKYAGKYDLIDVAGGGEEEEEEEKKPIQKLTTVEDKDGIVYAPSKLNDATQSLIRLIFDTDMFKEALKTYDIDVKKMPLGKLSRTQIAKGFEILEELEAVMENKKNGSYADISSKFYTVIPHDFGRTRPKPIDTREALQQKYDMLAVLADIELAQSIQKDKDNDATAKKKTEVKPHPYDVNYGLLKCSLEHLDVNSDEFKTIKKYTENTQGYRKCKIIDVWRVGREGESTRFAAHDKLDNRKLLWHGTNVAVVVAILKSGLRIMPHSGGRVGKGIYFASENGKSSGYVGVTQDQGKQIGIMFLNEVALGKEHTITTDDSSLKKPPANFDSVVARGQTEPDPKDDTPITIDGKKVIVPAGKPIRTTYTSSSFSQSEYLVYKESQCRIRYLLKMQF